MGDYPGPAHLSFRGSSSNRFGVGSASLARASASALAGAPASIRIGAAVAGSTAGSERWIADAGRGVTVRRGLCRAGPEAELALRGASWMVAFTDDTGGFAVMVHCWVCYTTPRAQGYGGTGANVRTMADLATEVAGFDLESVGNAAGHTTLIQDVIWNSCATERDKDGLCGAHAAAHDDEVVPVEVQKARSDILCRVV